MAMAKEEADPYHTNPCASPVDSIRRPPVPRRVRMIGFRSSDGLFPFLLDLVDPQFLSLRLAEIYTFVVLCIWQTPIQKQASN